MNRMRFVLILLLGSAGLIATGPHGLAAQPMPLGPEVQMRSNQLPENPVLAVQPGGDYVIAWDDEGNSSEVSYRYVAHGREPESVGPSPIESPKAAPEMSAVTATPKGFDVLWHVPVYQKPRAFYRRHLDLHGVPDGGPIQLGVASTDWVWNVRGNGFVAGWALPRVHGIAARRLTSSGQRTGPEMRLNSRPVDAPTTVVLAVADGGFVAVWFGNVSSAFTDNVLRARRFSPAGKPLGPDFDVNTIAPDPGGLTDFVVAASPGGGFAVAWALDQKIYLRFFNAAGKALGPQVAAVVTEGIGGAYPQSLAFDKAGNPLLLWVQGSQDSTNLQLQLFDSQGAPLGPQQDVNSEASGAYQHPWQGSAAWAGDSWLVIWTAFIEDESTSAIFVRRFAAN